MFLKINNSVSPIVFFIESNSKIQIFNVQFHRKENGPFNTKFVKKKNSLNHLNLPYRQSISNIIWRFLPSAPNLRQKLPQLAAASLYLLLFGAGVPGSRVPMLFATEPTRFKTCLKKEFGLLDRSKNRYTQMRNEMLPRYK